MGEITISHSIKKCFDLIEFYICKLWINNFLFYAGKTVTAISLAKQYEASILTVDQIVVDSISSGNTPAGMRARALCQEAARKRIEELKLLEGEDAEKKPGGLSIEQLTAHTQGTSMFCLNTEFGKKRSRC